MDYKLGEFVYSWVNPTHKLEIKNIKNFKKLGKVYKLKLSNGHLSNWLTSDRLSRKPI